MQKLGQLKTNSRCGCERAACGGFSLIQWWHKEVSLCLTSPSATSQLLPELGISAINWHFQGGYFQGIDFFQWLVGMMQNLGLFLFCCWFLLGFGVFLLVGFKSEMSLMSEIWPNPCALSRESHPHWHNILSPSYLFLLFSLSASHASISACWDHHKMGSSHWNFMPAGKSAPAPHRETLEPSITQEHGGEWGKITFSSCLFSMEKLIPLNGHFLVISHSEKLLLRFFSRNLHFCTVWGYSMLSTPTPWPVHRAKLSEQTPQPISASNFIPSPWIYWHYNGQPTQTAATGPINGTDNSRHLRSC